jgi:hypothetical protein
MYMIRHGIPYLSVHPVSPSEIGVARIISERYIRRHESHHLDPRGAPYASKAASACAGRYPGQLNRFAETGAGDVKKLTGRPGARLRVGDYRVVFIATPDTVDVRAVGHRRDIYS